MQFTPQEKELLTLCLQRMIEVNNHHHGEMCCNILLGPADRSEELQKLLAKITAGGPMELIIE